MEINTSLLFLQAAIFSSLILVIVSAIKLNVIRRDYSYFMVLVLTLITATIGDYLLRPKYIPQSNNIIYNIYSMMELPICVYILFQFHFRKIPTFILYGCAALFYSLVVFETYNIGIEKSFYLTNYLASFFEISVSIYTLVDILETPNESLIYKSVSFWFSLGFLLYNAGTTFLFLLMDKIYALDQTLALSAFNVLNSVFSILFYIFLAISILCLKPKTHSS